MHLQPPDATDRSLVAAVVGSDELASRLLSRFGGLPGLAATPPHTLATERGMGVARAARLSSAFALSRRAATATVRRPRFDRPAVMGEWLVARLGSLPHEELHALYLDARLRLVDSRRLTVGSAQASVFDAMGILRGALELRAPAMVVAHNHPSGDPTPSREDVAATRRLSDAARVVGIRFVDHIIVGGAAWTSMAARGEIDP